MADPESTPQLPPPSIPIPPPIITTPRFIIRPFHPSDAPPMATLYNNPKISRYMRNTFPFPYTPADAEFWINLVTGPNSPHIAFGIFVPVTPSPSSDETTYTLAGSIGLQRMSDVEVRTMNLGYVLGEPYWGQGIMTEATVAFSRWALESMPEEELTRLDGAVFEGNTASMMVLTKAGFKFEGVRRKAVWKNGEALDQYNYGLLRGDLL